MDDPIIGGRAEKLVTKGLFRLSAVET
jgi:hypothetical protein